MPWPAPNEFREAIHCPHLCFRDPDLKSALVIKDKQGLPAVSSGNFASVYSLELPSGKIAIRCFNHSVPDQDQRYDEISRQLQMSNLAYTVDFQFIAKGILVNGDWFPILRMEWVEGDGLINYIEKNLTQTDKLMSLAKQWMQMSRKMQRACIAHGDLQHGNVIIRKDEIKLIDYDGMYVPALDGLQSNERGHRNYQHPQRQGEFGPQLDNFSNWVMYCSLLMLSLDPSLWDLSGKHDEYILLSADDFREPESSAILQALAQHEMEQIREIAGLLRNAIASDFALIPDLDHSAPLPMEESQDLTQFLLLLGLDAGASMDDIQQSSAIFSRVWAPRFYRISKRLAQRAELKLAELEKGSQLLKAVI